MASIGIGGSGGSLVSYHRASVTNRQPQTSITHSNLRGSQSRRQSNYPSLEPLPSPVKSENENSLYQLRDLSTPLRKDHPLRNLQSNRGIPSKLRDFLLARDFGRSGNRLELKVPKIDAENIFKFLESTNDHVRYSYSWIDETLVVYPMASAAHEALLLSISLVHKQLVDDIRSHVPEVRFANLGAALTHLRNAKGRTRKKAADASINIKLGPDDESVFPRIAFEIGVSETEAELERDARHWLYETGGRTTLVGIIKFIQPSNAHNIDDWEVTMKFYQRYEVDDDGTSDDRDRNASKICSYEDAIARVPLQELGTTMKLLPHPGDLPLTLVLHAEDLFSDDEVEEHRLHNISWTLDFSEFPDSAREGIKDHIARMQDNSASGSDCDNSGDFGESCVWRPLRKRRRLNAKEGNDN